VVLSTHIVSTYLKAADVAKLLLLNKRRVTYPYLQSVVVMLPLKPNPNETWSGLPPKCNGFFRMSRIEPRKKPLHFGGNPDHVSLGLGLGLIGSITTTLCREGYVTRRLFNSNNFATSAALAELCALQLQVL